jgi:glutathione peroxidase
MKSLLLTFSLIMLLSPAAPDPTIYQFTLPNIDGENVSLSDYAGKVVLIVNVASKCGLTPQYEDLEALYQAKKDQGLVILGFPANNFASQEPGSEEEIKAFCQKNYGVSFPMFSKISVKGEDIHPLYQFLTEKERNGVMDSKVSWNFQKYLIDRDGKLREVIEPRKNVRNDDVLASIEKLLAEG